MKHLRCGVAMRALALGTFACTALQGCAVPEPAQEKPFEAQGLPIGEIEPPAAAAAPMFTDCPDGFESELVNEEPRCVPAWTVAPPDFSTCPAGWKSTSWGIVAKTDVCVPEAPTECGSGERADMESGQCVVVGSSCPSGSDWADPPTGATTVLYVRPGGSGSGTQAAPFGTLDAAITAAPAGATILLAAGEYVTTSQIANELTIVGACASETRIVGTSAPVPEGVEQDEQFEGALHVHDAGKLTLSNVTLAGPRIALTVKAGGSAAVEDVIVTDFTPHGVWVQDEGSVLTVAHSSFVGGTIAAGKEHAAPVEVAWDAMATITDSAFSGNQGRVVLAKFNGHLSLEDVSIVDAAGSPDGEYPAIGASLGGEVEASRVRVSGFDGSGVGLVDGAKAKLSWTLIEHGEADTFFNAAGINSNDTSTVECDHCLFSDIAGIAVFHQGEAEGESLKLVDVVAAEMRTGSSGEGTLLSIQDGDFALSRVALLDFPRNGIYGSGGHGRLEDVRLATRVKEQMAAHGVAVGDGTYELSRVAIEGRSFVADGAHFSLDEVSVSDWGGVTEDTGRLIGLQLIGDGEATHLYVAKGYGFGLSAYGGEVAVNDVVVDGVKPKLGTGHVAVGVLNSATLQGQRWLVRDASGMGVWSQGKLQLSDVLVTKTQSDLSGALAAGAYLLGHVDVSRLRVEKSCGAGLYLSGAKATLADVTITESLPTQTGARYGQGLYVDGSQVDAERVAISEVYEAGVVVESSTATLRDLNVWKVHPTAYLQSQGAGLWAMGEGLVTLERAQINEVHAVGLGFSQGASLSATNLDVRHVQIGRSLLLDAFGAQSADGVGDCLLLAEGSKGSVDRAVLDDCARSGILLYRGEAQLGSVELRHTPVGLITQFASLPEYEPSNVCTQDVATVHLDDPGYPVPAGPPVGQALSEGVEFGDLFREDP